MKKWAGVCLVVLSMVFSVLLVSEVLAQTIIDSEIEQRIENQQKRIEDGIRAGQLTREEARTLKNNLNDIQEEAFRLQADGRLTPREKDKLISLLDKNSEMIREKRHNPITSVSPGRPTIRDDDIRDIIARQQVNINQGIRSGQLTEREARILNENLDHIREEEAHWRRYDGKLTEDARQRLMSLLERNAEMIRDKRNNPIVAFGQPIRENEANVGVGQRVANQQNSIDQGIRAGRLTRGEARILHNNLAFVVDHAKGAKRDGVVTDGEIRRLNMLLDRNIRMIGKLEPIRQLP